MLHSCTARKKCFSSVPHACCNTKDIIWRLDYHDAEVSVYLPPSKRPLRCRARWELRSAMVDPEFSMVRMGEPTSACDSLRSGSSQAAVIMSRRGTCPMSQALEEDDYIAFGISVFRKRDPETKEMMGILKFPHVETHMSPSCDVHSPEASVRPSAHPPDQQVPPSKLESPKSVTALDVCCRRQRLGASHRRDSRKS